MEIKKSKAEKYGKMTSLKFDAKRNEGSESIVLSVRRIYELASSKRNILTKPSNQRDVKNLSQNAKKYFATLLWTAEYGKTICKDNDDIPELKDGNPVVVGEITLTQKPSLKNFDYQDGQHRIQYILAIINEEVALTQNIIFYNKDIPFLIDQLIEQAAAQNVDTSKGIYFSMLPEETQEAILNLKFNINVYYLNKEEACRTLFDVKNTCVSMSTLNKQKNINAGKYVYDLTNQLIKSFGKSKNAPEHPDFMQPMHIKLINQMMHPKRTGKGSSVSSTAMMKLMYRCMLAVEAPLDTVHEKQRAWDAPNSDKLENGFLLDHEDLTQEQAERLIVKTLNYMCKVSKMLHDMNEENSIFAGKLALLPAGIILCRDIEKDTMLKKKVFNLFKDPKIYSNFADLTTSKEYSKAVSSTYHNAAYMYTVYRDVYLGASEELKDLIDGKED